MTPWTGCCKQQPYRLAFWRVGLELINYRPFFSINDLIGIRIEDPRVFEAFKHGLIFKLVGKKGEISGLRVDHIDGLYDPLEYLQRLQACSLPKPSRRFSSSSAIFISLWRRS